MITVNALSEVAALMGDPARAAMLQLLMDGRAHTASELALTAGVTAQTASGHLGRMVDGHLRAARAQGRNRFYRLATSDVAHAIESLMAVAGTGVSPAGRVAIVVDQAIGRGHAMAGAIRLIRDARPSMIVAATPVASEAGAERFARAADKVVCLRREAELGPLDRYYGQAQQITHEEALDCLARAA